MALTLTVCNGSDVEIIIGGKYSFKKRTGLRGKYFLKSTNHMCSMCKHEMCPRNSSHYSTHWLDCFGLLGHTLKLRPETLSAQAYKCKCLANAFMSEISSCMHSNASYCIEYKHKGVTLKSGFGSINDIDITIFWTNPN